ncbi:MAG: hypothetical protein L3J71_07300 [Victivallaceae bacterium]|nr:hypothetical protein [Victivallaceae bacterium]
MKFSFKSSWQSFNQWRRRGMPFRLVVLLLIGTGPFIEWNMTDQHIPLINELVWTACRAIRYGSEPQVASTFVRGYKAGEKRRLQEMLRIEIAEKKIKLSESEQFELEQLPSKANLPILFTAAKRYNLLSHDASLRRLNRDFYAMAIGSTILRFDREWLEVKRMVYQKPDLTKWATWRGKIDNFIFLFMMILPLPLHIALLWGIIFFTIAFVVSGGCKLQRLRNSAAIIIPLVMFLLLLRNPSFKWLYHNAFGYYWSRTIMVFCSFIYALIFTVIASIYGIRLKRRLAVSEQLPFFIIGLLLLAGSILLFPFGFYSRSWLLPEILTMFWNGSLDRLILYSPKLILPLEIIGALTLGSGTILFNRQLGAQRVKYLDITITELGRYIIWSLGGIILFNRWVINFLTKADIMQFKSNLATGDIIRLDLNLALLLIVMLVGFSFSKFTQLSKTEKIVNIVMLIAMLVFLIQLCLFE